MRECVFATLPRWLVDTAERLLRETKKKGPGIPLEQRIDEALGWAARMRLTRAQLEQRIGKPAAAWTHEDVSDLETIASSIGRGETTAAEQFDPAEARVSVDELGDEPSAPAPAEPSQVADPVGDQRPATREQVTKVILMLRDLDIEEDDAQRQWLADELRRPITSRTDMTRGDASTVIDVLQALLDERGLPGGEG
jgi:hypothetical protein